MLNETLLKACALGYLPSVPWGEPKTRTGRGTKEAPGWRHGNLLAAGGLQGRRGVDRQGRTAQTGPPPATSTDRLTGGRRGRSGSPVRERAEIPLSLACRSPQPEACEEHRLGRVPVREEKVKVKVKWGFLR